MTKEEFRVLAMEQIKAGIDAFNAEAKEKGLPFRASYPTHMEATKLEPDIESSITERVLPV